MANIYPLTNRIKRFINIENLRLVQNICGKHINATRSSVLSTIATFAHDDGTSMYPSIKLLSKLTKLSESTVTRTLKALVKVNYLIKVRDTDYIRPTEYKLNLPLIETLQYAHKGVVSICPPPSPEPTTGGGVTYAGGVVATQGGGGSNFVEKQPPRLEYSGLYSLQGVVSPRVGGSSTAPPGVVAGCHPNKVLITSKRTTTTNAREVLASLPLLTAVSVPSVFVDTVTKPTIQCSVVSKVIEDEVSKQALKNIMGRAALAAANSPNEDEKLKEVVLGMVMTLRGKITIDKVMDLVQTYGLHRTLSAVQYVKSMDIEKFYNLGGYLNKVILEGYGDKKTSRIDQNRPSSGYHGLGEGSQPVNNTLTEGSHFNDIHTIRDKAVWSLEANRKWFSGMTIENQQLVLEDVLRKWPALTHLATHEGIDIGSPTFVAQGLFLGVSDVINELRYEDMAKHLRSRI